VHQTVICADGTLTINPAGIKPFGQVVVHDTAGNSYAIFTCDASTTALEISDGFQPSVSDAPAIAGMIGSGFFILLPLWAAVYGARALLKAVR